MAVKIYGDPKAICVQRIAAVCIELGVFYESVFINFATREHKSAEFLSLQPFGKVPVLEDEGFFVYESRAICTYLAVKFSSSRISLIPTQGDHQKYALFQQACSIEKSYFDGPIAGICYQKFFKSRQGRGSPDEAVLLQHVNELDDTLAVYSKILSKQKYLAGDELTLADLYHLPYGAMLQRLGHAAMLEKYPTVNQWFKGLTSRDSWVQLTALNCFLP